MSSLTPLSDQHRTCPYSIKQACDENEQKYQLVDYQLIQYQFSNHKNCMVKLYGELLLRSWEYLLFFILIYHLLSKLVISKEISHSLERKGFLRKIIIQSMLTSEIVATKIEHLFQVLCNYKKRLKIEISTRAIENLN